MLSEGDAWYLILITVSTHVQTCGVTDIPINTFKPPLGHRHPLRESFRDSIADVFSNVFFQDHYIYFA